MLCVVARLITIAGVSQRGVRDPSTPSNTARDQGASRALPPATRTAPSLATSAALGHADLEGCSRGAGRYHRAQQQVGVFHQGGIARHRGDPLRGIEYVATPELGAEHILASSAIPALFPAVRVTTPEDAAGWYFDGGPRLNTPIKPAL
jgi:hypothetical protein